MSSLFTFPTEVGELEPQTAEAAVAFLATINTLLRRSQHRAHQVEAHQQNILNLIAVTNNTVQRLRTYCNQLQEALTRATGDAPPTTPATTTTSPTARYPTRRQLEKDT